MFRDALHTLTAALAPALLGTSIPLLLASLDSGISRRTEFIVVLSLVIAFAALTILYSLRAILLPAISPQTALRTKTHATLLVILVAIGAGFMGGLSSWAREIGWMQNWGRWFVFITDEKYERLEAMINGTVRPPWEGSGPFPSERQWRQWEVTNMVNSWFDWGNRSAVADLDVNRLGTATLVIGWILVALLVIELAAALLPSQRMIWLERTNGGITLRWQDRGIALSDDDDNEAPPVRPVAIA